MKQFYYQVKGKDPSEYSHSNWHWPPLFSGKVEADNKKQARLLIEDEYGRKFPLRVLSKDLEKEHYLLNIREIDSNDVKTLSLFDLKECKECGCKFRVID